LHALRRDDAAVGEGDDGGTMEFGDAFPGVSLEIELGIPGDRGFKLGCDQLGKVAAHALGHAAFGFAGDVNEERHLRHERQREEQDEAEPDAPVETPRPAAVTCRHTCTRCPIPSG
jgi:hypothetical protein